MARARFEREVLIAREIHHPNVCPVYDLIHGNHGELFLTMKLLEGTTLQAIMNDRSGAGLATVQSWPLLRQMAAGLDAAHAAGIVHRDFKPANVMIDLSRNPAQAVITDFGISRHVGPGDTLTATGKVIGTYGYIAPEILNGSPPGVASDIFSFGVTMREITAEPLPEAWQSAIARCTDVDPAKRPRSASEAVIGLEAVSPPDKTTDTIASPANATLPEPPTRRKLLQTALVAGAGAAATGVGFGWRNVYSLLHPLPAKRFVALIPWPAGEDGQLRGLVRSLLEAIESRLTQAESASKNLMIISKPDPRDPLIGHPEAG